MNRTTPCTRRQILGGAASALAFPTIVPSTIFGTVRKSPPSERITVGYIGCGKMANDYHLPELLGFGDVQRWRCARSTAPVANMPRSGSSKRIARKLSTRDAQRTSTSVS